MRHRAVEWRLKDTNISNNTCEPGGSVFKEYTIQQYLMSFHIAHFETHEREPKRPYDEIYHSCILMLKIERVRVLCVCV